MHLTPRPDVQALEAAGDVSGLIRALSFEADPTVRFWAALALGKLRAPQALEPLSELIDDPAVLPRRGAATAVGQLGDRAGAPVLVAALGDPDPEVRKSAARALGELGDPRGIPPLLAALADASWLVRCCAAEALGRLGADGAVIALIAALDDPEEIVREHAAQALTVLDTPEARAALARFQSRDAGAPQDTSDLLGYPLGTRTAVLLERAVDELIVLIDCETGHIPASLQSIQRAREIGSRLHNSGGFPLMQQASALLRTRRPLWHELVSAWWDGIGDWLY